MTLYWKLRDIPELQPLTSSQQTEVWSATSSHRLKDPVVLSTMVICAILGGMGGALGSTFLSYAGLVVGVVIGGGIGSLIFWQVAIKRSRPHLANEIRSRKL